MKKLFLQFLLGVCPLFLLTAQEGAIGIPEIRKTVSILADEAKRLAETQAASDRQSQAAYKTQLAALRRAMQQQGDLDSVLAVDKETRRFDEAVASGGDEFEPVPDMPAAALVDAPAALRAAQDGYLRQRQGTLATRQRDLAAVTQQLVARLEEFQKEFTKAGKIDEAVAIRELAGRFKAAVETQSVERLAQSLLNAQAAPQKNDAAARAPWQHWRFVKNAAYSPHGGTVGMPGLPEDMTLEFSAALGKGSAKGRPPAAAMMFEGKQLARFGRLLQWDVAEPRHLNATIALDSALPLPEVTPVVNVRVLSGETQLADIRIPVSALRMTIRVTTPQDAARASVYCEQADPQTTAIDLPPGAPLAFQLGFNLHQNGAPCDISFAIE